MANKLKKIIENTLLTIFAINFTIFGSWCLFVLFFVDTTQPLQDSDTLLNFIKLYYEMLYRLVRCVVDFFFAIAHN